MTFETGPLLVQASRWIKAFWGRWVVIKVGGETLERKAALDRIVRQVRVLEDCGLRPVLVHGAGVQLDQACRERGLEIVKVGGRRVTTPETLEALVDVLTVLNRDLCALLTEEGLHPRGMDQGIHQAIRCIRRAPSEREGRIVDWGEVGDVVDVDRTLLMADGLPVLPSLGVAPDGFKNINADSCASHAALAVGAFKLLFLTSTPGVMRNLDDEGPISEIDAASAEQLIQEGRIQGGMKAKLEESFKALEGGVRQVHILSGRDPYGILREIYTDEGVGTLIRQ
jgi:acetylglutamate kinase